MNALSSGSTSPLDPALRQANPVDDSPPEAERRIATGTSAARGTLPDYDTTMQRLADADVAAARRTAGESTSRAEARRPPPERRALERELAEQTFARGDLERARALVEPLRQRADGTPHDDVQVHMLVGEIRKAELAALEQQDLPGRVEVAWSVVNKQGEVRVEAQVFEALRDVARAYADVLTVLDRPPVAKALGDELAVAHRAAAAHGLAFAISRYKALAGRIQASAVGGFAKATAERQIKRGKLAADSEMAKRLLNPASGPYVDAVRAAQEPARAAARATSFDDNDLWQAWQRWLLAEVPAVNHLVPVETLAKVAEVIGAPMLMAMLGGATG